MTKLQSLEKHFNLEEEDIIIEDNDCFMVYGKVIIVLTDEEADSMLREKTVEYIRETGIKNLPKDLKDWIRENAIDTTELRIKYIDSCIRWLELLEDGIEKKKTKKGDTNYYYLLLKHKLVKSKEEMREHNLNYWTSELAETITASKTDQEIIDWFISKEGEEEFWNIISFYEAIDFDDIAEFFKINYGRGYIIAKDKKEKEIETEDETYYYYVID